MQYIRFDDSIIGSWSFLYLLLTLLLVLLLELCTTWCIPPLLPFSIISYISVPVSTSSLIFVFFTHACNANPCAKRKLAGSSLQISSHLFVKLSNMFTSNKVSLCIYSSMIDIRSIIQNLPRLF